MGLSPETQTQVDEINRRYGFADFVSLVESTGKRVAHGRCQCPLAGCADKGSGARLNAEIKRAHTKEKWRVICYSCDGRADYLDLLQQIRGVDFAGAIQIALGEKPKFKPELKLLAPPPQYDAEKLKPSEVAAVWAEMAERDEMGLAYLDSRALGDAIESCRFATNDSKNSEVRAQAKAGFRVGMLLADLAGQPMGLQLRTVLPNVKDKQRVIKKSTVKQAFFGDAAGVLDASTIVICEGMADTLAAKIWVAKEKSTAVIGVAGIRNLSSFAAACEAHGIELQSRHVVLLAQHDKGPGGNKSLIEFTHLANLLRAAGAYVVICNNPPGESKDWAEALEKQVLPAWPPEQLARLREGVGESVEPSAVAQIKPGAVWQESKPKQPEYLGKDMETLQWLLSDDAHRQAICGPGDWSRNEMTGAIEYGGVALIDTDYTRIRIQIETYKSTLERKKLKFSYDDVRSVVTALADSKVRHPVREYLNGLVWDGVPRLHEIFGKILGLDAETQGLEIEYVRRWAISAVARVMRPGCKVDSVLVLQGPQGIRKSTFFATIAGEWAGTLSAEMGSPASIEQLRRAWIIELDELESIKRAREASTVTAFLTRGEDTYNAKWVRDAVTIKRHTIFGGTTNDINFLIDTTGSRRFWVVPCRQKINTELLAELRDQIFAEAVSEFKAGASWILDEETEALREEKNSDYRIRHPWEEIIKNGLRHYKGAITVSNILNDIIQKPAGQQSPYDAQQVSAAMRALGYSQVRRKFGGQRIRLFELGNQPND